ncbi:PREDICTED: ubiquitin carboxyl-terminal hydrolase 20-like isoform X5 [Vollenhovia emeryi]|uniref:ubiquitin carboxyl-terminal hydrolase 20-like isoform X5 n=1 Tax=Vollenhovia emeryi TaxID=411798 RepID=UPI0005F3A46D|nr:PREDICTED: ubiquitin carboxyl-terminal hydrolase 20-like isoform X5 [Vollenhovia emeryi]
MRINGRDSRKDVVPQTFEKHSTEKLGEIGEPRRTMSYHRGGQAGAVAVSYSTSPMAPHSPSRRYSSGTGSGSTAASAIGSTTSKFNAYRSTGSSSLLDSRPTSFYTTSSSSSLRSNYISSEYRRSYCSPGSFYSSASTGTSVRRNYSEYSRSNCSPARSVSSSSYGETGGSSGGAALGTTIVNGTSGTSSNSSSGSGRYVSSTSAASASSSSRERSSVDASAAAADIISRYSPAGYVPSIQRQQQASGGSAHHWRHRSTSSSLNELFGGDEREAERRDLRLESSSSSSSSVATGAPGLWSKSSKRRPPTNSSTVLTTVGHARTDSAVSLAEVTTTVDDHVTHRPNNDDDDDDDDDVNDDTKDDQHNNNGNVGNGEDLACGYGVNNNDNERDDDNDEDEDADGDENGDDANDDDNLNNCRHRFHQQRRHRSDEEGSPTNRSARSRLQALRDERCGLNGLRNIGNTCFMNSVIQCLSNTRPLLEYLLNEQYLADINTTTSSMKGALIKAFSQVIHELWEVGGDHVVNTTALKSQIQRFAPRFMGYSQQDAQEFLRYLLEGLHEDVNRVTTKLPPIHGDIPDSYTDMQKAVESWKRYIRSEDSTIVDVFVGQLRSSLRCTSCDHVSVTLDPFWDLSLPIPARSGTVKLSQCLEHFTREEVLDGDEKPTCSKCQMRRKCTKSFSIQKFPKILVIHLKRFSPMERFRGKLNVMVDFPLTGLDLSAFAAPRVPGCTYNLYGVANHSGTTYSGHYTAYCKHPYSGEWHEYNDSRVSVVSARSVVSSEAYVLFYEQQPHSSHL